MKRELNIEWLKENNDYVEDVFMQDNQRETVELAYSAGLIDGEGYIGIIRTKPNSDDKSPRIEPKIQVTMCDRKALDYLKEVFGGTLILRASNKKKWKDRYIWTLTNKEKLREVGKKLLPFLKTKKEQIVLLLSFLDDCPSKRRGRSIVSYEELLKREEFHQKMKKLNFRGVPATTNHTDTRESEVIV